MNKAKRFKRKNLWNLNW